jgi:hypothetical protein
MVSNFAGQWLLLRNVPAARPDPRLFPDFDENLRLAFRRETELLFDDILRGNRPAIELLTAGYTFVNERLARHYGIPNVYGNHFRRVATADGIRGGLLGQGSILTVTSHANRTSPTLRGVWILENILGAPVPAPPPDVPALPEPPTNDHPVTMRDRLAQHRANPTCASCHSRMDPLGFAMENFDAVGRWRADEGGAALDVSGVLPDGAKFQGPAGLRQALVGHGDEFVATLTEKLLTYALGRGVEYYDMPAVRSILRGSADSGHGLQSIVEAIAASAPFRMRRAGDPSSPARPAEKSAGAR